MPTVQKIEPVWIGAGQELSGESTNCSKLTFVPPGGTQTGIDRPSDPNTQPRASCRPPHPSPTTAPTQLSSSLHQSHLIVFLSVMLYTDNSVYIIPLPLSGSGNLSLLSGRLGVCLCVCVYLGVGAMGKVLMCCGSLEFI